VMHVCRWDDTKNVNAGLDGWIKFRKKKHVKNKLNRQFSI